MLYIKFSFTRVVVKSKRRASFPLSLSRGESSVAGEEDLSSSTSQKGISLYFSIIILSILLAIVLGLGTILVGQIRMIKGMGDSVVAFYGADTGIERILYEDKLCRQSGCDANPAITWPCVDTANCDKGRSGGSVTDSVGQAAYQVTFNNGATSITSIGMYSGTRRAIQVSR